jgi:hypothetical protein
MTGYEYQEVSDENYGNLAKRARLAYFGLSSTTPLPNTENASIGLKLLIAVLSLVGKCYNF